MNEPIQKIYFGARYFDPFFGMWMSPDPAAVFFREVYAPLKWRDFIEKDILQRLNGEAVLLKHSFRASAQFANPYSYGGDPLNYVDPNEEFVNLAFGAAIGWENGGFTAGVGAALDIGSNQFGVNLNVGAYHNFGNGSNTVSANAGVAVNIGIVGVGANLGYAYNTLSGGTLSYGIRGSICGAGIGVNGANYWNTSGSYMGGTIGLESFYGAFGAEGYAGYEWGYGGMNGREWYGGVRAFGFHTEYAQDGGLNFGGSFQAYLAYGNNTGKKGADGKTTSLVSAELWIPTLGKYGHFAFGETYDVSNEGLDDALVSALTREKILKEGERIDYKRPEALDAIHQGLLSKGYSCEITEPNTLFNQHDGRKFTYSKNGEYGNIEIIRGSKSYSSYNYGNNLLTHYLIDYRGYKGRGY